MSHETEVAILIKRVLAIDYRTILGEAIAGEYNYVLWLERATQTKAPSYRRSYLSMINPAQPTMQV